jgi:hypothetical protein
MTVQHERSNQKKLETTKGWYSESDMKDELGWKPILVKIIYVQSEHKRKVMKTSPLYAPLDTTEGSNQRSCCFMPPTATEADQAGSHLIAN